MVKKMMLEYIFQYVDRVLFHVGSENYRSQAAMRKLGATVVREIEVAYYGEPTRRNVEFEITRSNYRSENNRVNIKYFADNLYEKEYLDSKDDQGNFYLKMVIHTISRLRMIASGFNIVTR